MTTQPLDDFVCFAMYTASHATTQAYREVLKPWRLTYPQYLAMVVLATGERSVGELGEELGLDSGTLSPLLRRLDERGLVARPAGPPPPGPGATTASCASRSPTRVAPCTTR